MKLFLILALVLACVSACNTKKVERLEQTYLINLVDSNGVVIDSVSVNDSLKVVK